MLAQSYIAPARCSVQLFLGLVSSCRRLHACVVSSPGLAFTLGLRFCFVFCLCCGVVNPPLVVENQLPPAMVGIGCDFVAVRFDAQVFGSCRRGSGLARARNRQRLRYPMAASREVRFHLYTGLSPCLVTTSPAQTHRQDFDANAIGAWVALRGCMSDRAWLKVPAGGARSKTILSSNRMRGFSRRMWEKRRPRPPPKRQCRAASYIHASSRRQCNECHGHAQYHDIISTPPTLLQPVAFPRCCFPGITRQFICVPGFVCRTDLFRTTCGGRSSQETPSLFVSAGARSAIRYVRLSGALRACAKVHLDAGCIHQHGFVFL